MSDARPGLSLKARLLIGLSIVAAIAVGVAATVTVTTHSYLVTQLEERLKSYSEPFEHRGAPIDEVASDIADALKGIIPQLPSSDDDSDAYERPSDAYTGQISSKGGIYPNYVANTGDSSSSGPDLLSISGSDLPTSGDVYLTVGAEEGDDTFLLRIEYVESPSSSDYWWEYTALSKEGVNDATQRLIVIEAFGIGALLAGLALVGLWVTRLGISPMRRMVDASKQIAEGDLSVRLEGASAGSESHDLALALNAMIGRLTASLAERERSEAKLREFVADASHELRTPLTTVLGYAQLYRKGALADKADVDDAWERTEAEAGRMKRLVEDMLELAKYDALPELQRVETDLSELAAEVVGDSAAADPDTEFALETEGPARAAVDPDKVRQAVINIVRNAAVHGGDHVVVRVSCTDGAVRIAVEDDGPGMSPEIAARASERFVRGDTSRSRATGGAGLGLAITAAIVDAHGGTLSVASAEGDGTTVTLTLPRAALPGSPSAPTAQSSD